MKLFKKLLPIATLSSVAAIAVPMLVSCNNDDKSIWDATWKIEDGLWEPTVGELPGQEFESESAALSKYFEGIANNELLLAEDIISSQIIQTKMSTKYQTSDVVSSRMISYDSTSKTDSFAFLVEGWDNIPFGERGHQYIRTSIEATNIKLCARVENVPFVGTDPKDMIVIAPENNKTSMDDTIQAWLNTAEDWEVSVNIRIFRFSEYEFEFKYNKQYILDCQAGKHPDESLDTMVWIFEKMPIYSKYLYDCYID